MTNDPNDLDRPPILCTPAQRAERLNADQLRRMAANGTVETAPGLSIYGTVGAFIALTALGFVVALCVATAITLAGRP